MNKKTALLWIAILSVSFFLLGILAGRYITELDEEPGATYLENLSRDLGLSEDQRNRIADLLFEEDEAIRRIMDRHRDPVAQEIHLVRERTKNKICTLLDENQAGIFNEGGNF